MIAILETDDPVRLHFVKLVLEAAELHPMVVGAVYPSLPTRLMVPESEVEMARHTIAEAERAQLADDDEE